MIEPASADAVGATLVFLHLLKGQTDGLAELFLTHTEQRATQANARADMHVDRVRLVAFAAASAAAGDGSHMSLWFRTRWLFLAPVGSITRA